MILLKFFRQHTREISGVIAIAIIVSSLIGLVSVLIPQ